MEMTRMRELNYWLHRCAYEGGHEILDAEHRLTIGFSKCAKDHDMVDSILRRDGQAFDENYERVYGGDIWKARYSLWYFTCEMAAGDIIVVPRSGGFTICRLKDACMLSQRRNEADIGWEWPVEILADMCAPRDAYAPIGLLSRMKCRQTTLNIGNLAEDVDFALTRFQNKNPFTLFGELAEKCHEALQKSGAPDHFERLVLDYFTRQGAEAQILSKNYSGTGEGDCDVSAVFSPLHLTISVQCKKHEGETNEFAVQQIVDYANRLKDRDDNWTYVNWVVSFADDFTKEAKERAAESGVILINGQEFCKMLITNGIGV